ncbi:RNA polymerase sporulation sigma factor SigH [Salicibibacter cibarius]|uniref:RNA polymerase sporulation sigma factor SigH n=1 Tax=Salicibibacter cibarius TaxID=2743000 RepID=A0A7T6YZS3_9BACI|nr:RNA polymerase sporulation sigma factor SigH [Salicibibacter cibarius]QQK74320.1 RNA polymerase sporulation sigma factor SigH [Salicibibacter cibarius]
MVVNVHFIETKQRYVEETEEERLIKKAHQGDSAALEKLIHKYKNFVRVKSRSYFLMGADHEDIVQEGMIGLFKAIRDFKGNKRSSFRAFAELCITRQIITAVKAATRQKHFPLNSYVSLDKPIYDEESERTLMDVICGTIVTNPEEMLINQEDWEDVDHKITELLSELEQKVLRLYLDGHSYQEISVAADAHEKSIDNALQRVKRKLEKFTRKKKILL